MRSAILFACLVGLALPADAYEQAVHVYLSRRGYAGQAQPSAATSSDAAAVRALRERIWRAGSEARDPDVKRRFLARWPGAQAFDAWAMKQLFALNPEQHVAGFDDDVALPSATTPAEIYAAASRLPDDDERNRRRYRHDAARAVVHDPWGRPLPDDPATLEMGSLQGLSSQAHAHYGLPKLAFSDDPSVLKSEPRRFAIPPTVHTFGADFAESYTMLAALAARLPGGQRLALTHAGAAAHHIEDVANQIHTVQVGIYEFFVDAKIESYKEELRSAGGLLRPRSDFVTIGIEIIANHHVLAEGLYAKHLLDPKDPVAAQTAAAPADDTLQRDLDAQPKSCSAGFARTLTRSLIDRSSFEGAEVYRAIRRVAQTRFSRAGVHYNETDDPDAALKPDVDLAPFFALEAAGARRAGQALAAWWSRFNGCAALDDSAAAALAEQLVRDRLDALDAAEGRARMWSPKPPERERRNWWVPIGYVVAFLVIVLLVRRRLRRRRA
ncbi:MAG: hypothetical protein JWN44_7247 [Myxococcales bacterium]|nr:hypothetical protein [Myxococcales bacterium]